MQRSILHVIGIFLIATLYSATATAGPSRCAPDGIAVGGYDLISYRQESGPRMGEELHTVEHDGLRYLFANGENKALFKANPTHYLPVYQGWCAATLAMGRLACPDYANFKLEEGRLLFFELAGFTNGRTLWNSDPLGFRRRADDNASKLLNRE